MVDHQQANPTITVGQCLERPGVLVIAAVGHPATVYTPHLLQRIQHHQPDVRIFRQLRLDLLFQPLPDGRSPVAEMQARRRGVGQPQSPAVQPLRAVLQRQVEYLSLRSFPPQKALSVAHGEA